MQLRNFENGFDTRFGLASKAHALRDPTNDHSQILIIP